jgi:putative molybdopterin biosynthesis protein
MQLAPGYRRRQGIVYRCGDVRFEGKTLAQIIATVTTDPDCLLINRNPGSGTRILIDRLLGGTRPAGYAVQATNHNAVAAAVAQGRADWGLAIESVAVANQLGFVFYQDEQYDFVIPKDRCDRPAVRAFMDILSNGQTQRRLAEFGFQTAKNSEP